jgi:tetratricopeptide (TPR) repeat protein
MARRTDDPATHAFTLVCQVWSAYEWPDARAMLDVAGDLSQRVGTLGRRYARSHIVAADRHLAAALLRLGRRREAEHHLELAEAEAAHGGQRMARHHVLLLRATLTAASGQFADARQLASDAAEVGNPRLMTIKLCHDAQVVAQLMDRGQAEHVIAGLRAFIADGPQLPAASALFPAARAVYATALAEVGRVAEASKEFGKLIDSERSGLPSDSTVSLAVRYLPELCRLLADSGRASALLPHIEPWSGQLLLVGAGTSLEGASDRSVAHLLAQLGRYDEAEVLYRAAADLEGAAGFPVLMARTKYWHARLLLDRRAPGDHHQAGALFDDVVDVADRFGMRLLAEQARDLREGQGP